MELSISLLEVGLDRKVEFGGEIEFILQQSRVLLHDLQYTVQFAIKVLTATRAHAQCVLVALGMESARARLLVMKLGFLRRRMMDDGVGVGAAMMSPMCDDVESTCLVKECRELEEVLGTSFTEILMGGEMVGMKEVKKIVKEVDRKLLLSRCRGKGPMIASVGEDGGWLRLWDEALNLGERHTKGLKNLSRVLSHHGRGSKSCPLCDWTPEEENVFEHILLRHGEELGLKGMKHDEVLQNLKPSDLKFVYVFYKMYCMF